MGQTLYLECYSGISGDMMVAALLDLGADQASLQHTLNSLCIENFQTEIRRVKKAALDACDFNVILDAHHENHDHDMEYLHSHTPGHTAQHQHHTQEHTHQNQHTHVHQHEHEHRSLSDIIDIINQADMTNTAKRTATKIFMILGEAEAKAHGTSLKHVHFHEVGALDSIVDIISAAVCLDNLNITDVIIPVLHEGCGTIRCAHGVLPIPVPAVTNIIQAHNLKLHMTETQGEFVTPTGAAIAAAICTSKQLPEQFGILRTGLGAGKRNYERPSILRAMLIEPANNLSTLNTDTIYKLESNLDDCTPEALGYVLECLMDAGAKDVHYFPVFMKKNRPAYQLNVLCKEADMPKIEQIIFSQTTTIGIRKQRMERSVLPRELKTIQTAYGEVQVKICGLDGQVRVYPEYDSLVRICRKTGDSYIELYRTVQKICHDKLYLS